VRFATSCFQNNWGNSRSTSLWYGIVKVLHLKEISYILHHCGRVLNNRCYWTNLLITNDSRLQLELSSSYRPKYFYCKWRIFDQGRAIPGSPITLEYNPLPVVSYHSKCTDDPLTSIWACTKVFRIFTLDLINGAKLFTYLDTFTSGALRLFPGGAGIDSKKVLNPSPARGRTVIIPQCLEQSSRRDWSILHHENLMSMT